MHKLQQGWAVYEHFIVLVSYNGHGRIHGTQLLKSMPTIRPFENKIDLLDASTVTWCTAQRAFGSNTYFGESFEQAKGKSAFICDW